MRYAPMVYVPGSIEKTTGTSPFDIYAEFLLNNPRVASVNDSLMSLVALGGISSSPSTGLSPVFNQLKTDLYSIRLKTWT